MSDASMPWSASLNDGPSPSRLAPRNLEAERSALGCALLSNEAVELMLTQLSDDDFYDPAHQVIFSAIRNIALSKKPVDQLMVGEELERQGKIDEVGGRIYLSTLTEEAPVLSNAPYYISLVREKSRLRQMISSLNEVIGLAYEADEANKILDLAVAKLFELQVTDPNRGPKSLNEIIPQVINEIQAIQDGELDGLRVKTGYPSLDRLLGGLKPGTLNIVAARPAMGKSALAINIAQKVSVDAQQPVAIFSLEMNRSEIGIRLISAQTLLDSSQLSAGRVSADEWVHISRHIAPLYSAPLFVDDRAGAGPFGILSECRRLKMEHGLSLIIIDYMQLMRPDGRHESRQQEISEISRNLKLMARELEVPVIALSQLSRAVEMRQNKRPLLSDLRESGSIEQDADTVMFIYRDSYYQDEPEGDSEPAEVIIAKNRGGATGTVHLTWIPRYTLFVDEDSFEREAPPEFQSSFVPEPPDVAAAPVPGEPGNAERLFADPGDLPFDLGPGAADAPPPPEAAPEAPEDDSPYVNFTDDSDLPYA